MLEMASQGAKVLQTRSVEMAMNHGVRLYVRSTFTDSDGTLVCDEDEILENQVVSGIAYSRDEAKITLVQVPDRPGVAAAAATPGRSGTCTKVIFASSRLYAIPLTTWFSKISSSSQTSVPSLSVKVERT